MKYLLSLLFLLTSLFAQNNQNIEGRYDLIYGKTTFDTGEVYKSVAITIVIEKLSSNIYGYVYVYKSKDAKTNDSFSPLGRYGLIKYIDSNYYIDDVPMELKKEDNILIWVETSVNAKDEIRLKELDSSEKLHSSLKKVYKNTLKDYEDFKKSQNF